MRYKSYLLLSLVLFFSRAAIAETMFIDDTLVVPLRAGESLEYRIVHKGVKSGTPVTVLSKNNASGYAYVETPDGVKGYMPTRFLTGTPIARARLADIQKQLDSANEKFQQIQQAYNQLKSDYDNVSQAQKKAVTENSNINEELTRIRSISANAVNLDTRNKELHEENEKLRSDVELLTAENQHLKDNSDTDFMMIGGGLVVLGIFIALIVPMLKPTKKHDSWV